MRYKAVLFDLDGTLINTIDLYAKAVIEAITSYGIPATEEMFRQWYMAGTRFEEIFAEHNLSSKEVPEFRRKRDARYVELLCKTGWQDGAVDILQSLKGKVPLGIVTGSWRRYIDPIEQCLQISSYVDIIITADDMEPFHKPHPHSLFLASERLQVEPENAIYIGDQRFDLIAARAAKMPNCLVISNHTPLDATQYADYTVSELRELHDIL